MAWLSAAFWALSTVLPLGGCELFNRQTPPRLDYLVTPEATGVRVAVTIDGGPSPAAWVGFGASPLGTATNTRTISDVTARTVDGTPLSVTATGDAAFQVDGAPRDGWVLNYRLTFQSPPAHVYQRASSSSSAHLMLIGVDAWARFFGSAAAVSMPPEDRPLDEVGEVTIRFETAGLPEGWQVASASPERAPNHYVIVEHPARSAFAVGPYRVETIDAEIGLRAAIHSGWGIARGRLVNFSRQLARVQAREFGPPPGEPPLMVFTPLPPGVSPRQGVRTAGMVWDRTLILYAGAAPGAPATSSRIREMVAIFLGHELFHLYVPWGLPITQPLSWLSEGWAEHVGRSSARTAGILSAAGADRSLREAYERYREMGGARAGSLQDASESGEELRDLLYVRGELVFRILGLEWQASGKQGVFDSVLWSRLQTAYDGAAPLEPQDVSSILGAMVSPTTVRRYVDGAAVITLPELALGRR